MVRERVTKENRIVSGILDAAAHVLAERGDAVSMAEIATAAGVGRATLYRHFPTRDELLLGLAETALGELCGRIEAAELDSVPVETAVARLSRAFMATGVKYAALMRTKKREIVDDDTLELRITAPVRDLLFRGVRDGALRSDLPATVLLEMFTALLERGLVLVVGRELGSEQAATAVTAIFLDGAACRN